MERDMCWLGKKVDGPSPCLFYIESIDAITDTIVEEMDALFVRSVRTTEKEKATILFEIIHRPQLGEEGFGLASEKRKYTVSAQTTKGLLYGMFRLREMLVLNKFEPCVSVPSQSIRMINHWDNMDGSIERGYAGDSIFYTDHTFRKDYKVVKEYARLLASVGVNALSLNNVNVHKRETRLITSEDLHEVKKYSDIFSRYGIRVYLSINFASPKIIGGLSTADPLDEQVICFWKETIDTIYSILPQFGGFVVKADSEGEPGPFAYGRGHDDGANLFGRLLKPYGGHCIWRCFVYNHKQNWRDRSIDRARAAYDHFMPLDGNFVDNVSLQIKLGPLDFQVREPISPLFGGLRKTNHIIEFQLTQEYTGHQKAIYYMAPVWKETLDFDCQYESSPGRVKELLKRNSPVENYSGMCAVGVVGMDLNWTKHKLMQINLYAYGKLCWDNELTSEQIAERWIRLTFTLPEQLEQELKDILLTSRETYALYVAPRGVGFMVKPHLHDGPDVDGYEYSPWGTYHFADCKGIGNDRTVNGTGFVSQYSPAVRDLYNQLETCPDELLLWFHHVPYTHVLQNGKTLIQDIYDTHFEGVERVERYVQQWKAFQPFVEEVEYTNVSELLAWQLELAKEWRDQINTYFFRKSGICDQHNRTIYN